MQFTHPVSGYKLVKNNIGTWAFLFGPLYFLSCEIYNQAILMAIVLGAAQAFAMLSFGIGFWAIASAILLVHGVYAVLAEAIIEAHFRRHGWTVD